MEENYLTTRVARLILIGRVYIGMVLLTWFVTWCFEVPVWRGLGGSIVGISIFAIVAAAGWGPWVGDAKRWTE